MGISGPKQIDSCVHIGKINLQTTSKNVVAALSIGHPVVYSFIFSKMVLKFMQMLKFMRSMSVREFWTLSLTHSLFSLLSLCLIFVDHMRGFISAYMNVANTKMVFLNPSLYVSVFFLFLLFGCSVFVNHTLYIYIYIFALGREYSFLWI